MKRLLLTLIFLPRFFTVISQEITGPFAGGVTENSAVFIIASPPGSNVKVEYSETVNFTNSLFTGEQSAGDDAGGYTKHQAGGLKSDTKYFYRGVINGVSAARIHSFKTFTSEKSYSFSFGFGSCMQSTFTTANPYIFRTIGADTSLRFFLHLGDWSYPDFIFGQSYSENPVLLKKSYDLKYSYEHDFPRYVLSVMPVAYVYDDHDYAWNNSDGSASDKQNSINAYRLLFPHYKLASPDDGIWQSFKFADAEFFMLDVRSQRDPNHKAIDASGSFSPGEGHSILGTSQLEWLLGSLKKSTARWKVIVSPVMFNPKYGSLLSNPLISQYRRLRDDIIDKWAGFPEDYEKLISTINQSGIKNVIVISGDSHSSFIDDETNSMIPEIGSSNLDINNTKLNLTASQFGYTLFNQGGYDGDGRAHGRVTFTDEYALMEIIDEKGIIAASYRLGVR